MNCATSAPGKRERKLTKRKKKRSENARNSQRISPGYYEWALMVADDPGNFASTSRKVAASVLRFIGDNVLADALCSFDKNAVLALEQDKPRS